MNNLLRHHCIRVLRNLWGQVRLTPIIPWVLIVLAVSPGGSTALAHVEVSDGREAAVQVPLVTAEGLPYRLLTDERRTALATGRPLKEESSKEKGSEEPVSKWFGYTGGIGVSFKLVGLDILAGSENLVIASMESEYNPSLFFNMASPVRYFGNSWFGYQWVYAYSGFSLDKQQSFLAWEPTWQDMGTSVTGRFLYVMPVLVWQPYTVDGRTGFKWGIGYGLGYLSMEGDVLVSPDPISGQRFRHEIDVNEITTGFYIGMEFGGRGLFSGVSIGSMNGSTGPYNYELMNVSIDIGYRKEF